MKVRIIESLEQEALKYKTAQDFIDSQPIFYRGGVKNHFVSQDKIFASEYGEVIEYWLVQDIKLLNVMSDVADTIAQIYGFDNSEMAEDLWFNPNKKLIKILKKMGYDGFINDNNIYISNKNNLLTKSDLINIWKNAQYES